MTSKTIGDDYRESGEGETSRREFEDWAINQCRFDLRYSDQARKTYASMKTRNAWIVWQASRAAIEISMPPTVITAEIGPAVSLEKMTARLAVNGIKVKPDEQRNPTPS